MARGTSYNYALLFDDGMLIHPSKIGEIGEGEEGRIDVTDGSRKYKVRDQIFDIGEIEITILLTESRFPGSRLSEEGIDGDGNPVIQQAQTEYNYLQAWSRNGGVRDVSIVGLDVAGNVKRTWVCDNCELAMGKKNDFDRDSKAVDTKKYFLLPESIYDLDDGVASMPGSPGYIS